MNAMAVVHGQTIAITCTRIKITAESATNKAPEESWTVSKITAEQAWSVKSRTPGWHAVGPDWELASFTGLPRISAVWDQG